MYLVSEYAVLKQISDEISSASATCFYTIKAIYHTSLHDYYNFDVADIINVAKNNLGNHDALSLFGINERKADLPELYKWEFERINELFTLAFALRIPVLKIHYKFDDKQLLKIYNIVENSVRFRAEDIYIGDYEYFKKMAKKGSLEEIDQTELFDCDWYREYIKKYVPSLYELNNQNMLVFGVVNRLMQEVFEQMVENIGKIVSKAETA